jgi:macrolide-specific efflux system membrane fusion protein
MEFLRSVVKWLGHHRVASTVIVIALLASGHFARLQLQRTQGTITPPLVRGNISQSVYGIGTVTANRSFQLMPGVIGTIDGIFVREGETVKKGQKLLSIDHVLYHAPFDGTVTLLANKVGENVFSTVPVLSLVDLNDRYVLVSLEQQGALRVKPGQKVMLSFDTIRESNFEGTVTSIYSNSTGYLARIDIANLPPRILPFMTADVAITLRTHENALLIPVAALEQGKFVWLKRSIPKRLEVKTGIVDRDVAEIISGELQTGDRLVIQNRAAP